MDVKRGDKSYSRTVCHLVTELQTIHILEANMAVALTGLPWAHVLRSKDVLLVLLILHCLLSSFITFLTT